MAKLAIHLNDAAITLCREDGQAIGNREPGFAYLGDDEMLVGDAAFCCSRLDPRRIQHRFWAELTTDPLADSRFQHLSAADLASQQLESIWQQAGADVDALIVAVPPSMSAAQLGLFLGIARELSLPIESLADSAVAATRREYRGAVPVHIDLSLHSVTLTRLAQPGHAQVDRAEVIESFGTHALNDAWLHVIAEVFVQQSRFDPLHTAETEQVLQDSLAGWLDQAAGQPSVDMQIGAADTTYEASIESLALIAAVAPQYQQIAARLRTMFRAEDIPALQVTDRVSRLPGLTDMLKARVGGEVFVLEAGATARGALARCRSGAVQDAGVTLQRSLPWDQAVVDMTQHDAQAAGAGVPSHLLFRHRAYPLGNSELVLGSDKDSESRSIELPDDMPGVSRKHCSVTRDNGQCVIEDHSRYGTFLNGHRVDGSSVLHVGDAIRVGTPGYEFELILTEESVG